MQPQGSSQRRGGKPKSSESTLGAEQQETNRTNKRGRGAADGENRRRAPRKQAGAKQQRKKKRSIERQRRKPRDTKGGGDSNHKGAANGQAKNKKAAREQGEPNSARPAKQTRGGRGGGETKKKVGKRKRRAGEHEHRSKKKNRRNQPTKRGKKANIRRRRGHPHPRGGKAKQKDKAAKGKRRRTRTRPGGRPARPGQEAQSTRTNARDPDVASFDPQEGVSASTRNSPGAPISPLWNYGRYGKPGASVIGPHTPTTAAHAAQDRRRRDQPGITASRVPKRVQRGASPALLLRRGPAVGTMSPVLGRPPRAPRSCPVKPGAQAPGLGKGATASGKPTGAPRASGRDEARHTTWTTRHAREAHRRPSKAHGQVPSNKGCWVPQTLRARTTRNKPRHENRCQATPVAVRMDVCAPGSEPGPCRLRNSHCPDGRVCARRVPSPCRL